MKACRMATRCTPVGVDILVVLQNEEGEMSFTFDTSGLDRRRARASLSPPIPTQGCFPLSTVTINAICHRLFRTPLGSTTYSMRNCGSYTAATERHSMQGLNSREWG